jgi:hypothetical protein
VIRNHYRPLYVKIYTRIRMYVDGNSLNVYRIVKNVSNRRCKEKGQIFYARHTSSVQTKASERGQVIVCVFVLFDKQYALFPCSAAWKIGMDMLFCPYVSCYATPGRIGISSNLVCKEWGPDIVIGIASRYGLDGRGSNPRGDEISCNRPHRSWGHPAACAMGTVSLSRGYAAGAERVELYV